MNKTGSDGRRIRTNARSWDRIIEDEIVRFHRTEGYPDYAEYSAYWMSPYGTFYTQVHKRLRDCVLEMENTVKSIHVYDKQNMAQESDAQEAQS